MEKAAEALRINVSRGTRKEGERVEVISEDLYCEIIHDYKAGMTMREIADELHIDFDVVWQVCFEAEKLWRLNDGKSRLKKQRRYYEK